MEPQTNPFTEAEQVRPPEPSRRPTPAVVIVFAMIGMFVIVNAAASWQAFADIAPLVSIAYFLVLTRWARSE